MFTKQNILLYLREDFNRSIGFALIAHIIFFLILLLVHIFGDFQLWRKDIADVTVAASSVRVDIVGMPKFTIQELKKMKLVPIANEEEKSGVKSEEEKKSTNDDGAFKEKAKVNLNDLLKDLSKKSVETQGIRKNQQKTNKKTLDKNQLKQLVLEGNKLSRGADLVGSEYEQNLTAYTAYIGNLPNIVRPYWKLPSYLMDKGLKCRVRVYIGADGKVIKTEIFEQSGEEEFDRLATSAILKANPFPIPQKSILSKLTGGQVILGFPL